jgi:DNA-binding PadR family transcriptional regulator
MPKRESLGEFEQMVLLGILRLEPEASGPSIAEVVEEARGRRVSRGALYTTLARLEEGGLLRHRSAPGGPERGHLPRRLYAVSAAGKTALRSSRASLLKLWRGLDKVLGEPS